MDSIRSQLLEMGFHESKVKRAIESCPEAQTFEQVMEWLITHEDELNDDTAPGPADLVNVSASKPEGVNDKLVHKSPQAGGSNETAANMAARKKITVEEAQKIITERQAKRVEEERKKEIEDEKRRRLDGQKMAETRAELQDQERIRLAQQIRKEKLEKELHRKQVLEQIARDREAMKLKSNPKTSTTSDAPAPSASPSASSSTSGNSRPKVSVTECKIALRFPDGTNLVQKFSPQEQLAAVRLFVQMEKDLQCDMGVEFVAPPNKKLTESMMNETLDSLGLCPASRLEVKYKRATKWVDTD